MWPVGRLTNHSSAVPWSVLTNILQYTASDPPDSIICVWNVVRWASGSSTPVKTALTGTTLAGIGVSVIAWRRRRDLFSNRTPSLLLKSLTQLFSHFAKLIIPGPRGDQVLMHPRLFYARGFHSCLQRTHNLHHLRHGHGAGAFSSNGRNWTWTVASHFSHETWRITECNEQLFLQRRSIQRSIGENCAKLRKKTQEHRKLSTETCDSTRNHRFFHEKPNKPKNSNLSEQNSRNQQKTSPHRTKPRTNGGKRETTEQNLDDQRTVVVPPNKIKITLQ